jgi:bifunctional non-homologous end joining protein LigD
VRWVRPQLVGVIDYREFTGRRFRHPAWKGLISVGPQGITLPPLI